MTGKIRIAHVAPQLETGGMERLLVEFARHADRQRFAPRFIGLGGRGCVAEHIEASGWPVTALDAGPGVHPAIVYRLVRLFREERIDIVHTHNARALLYAGPAARLAGARVIHTRHGQRQGGTRRQDALVRFAGKCADRLVCVSEDARRLYGRDGIEGGCVATIWNGIDVERFTFNGPVADGPAVFVGRLSPEKDVATLLNAVALIVGRRLSFRLQIAGDGPYAAELRASVNSLGIREYVQFLGEVRDVPTLMCGASMLVLPSLTEGLPLTVLEGMACGLPVIATRVGGTPEAVVDGKTGLLVEPRDPAQLAGALLRVLGDSELARQMGQAGHQRVAELFDVRTMVSRYESLYLGVFSNDAVRQRNIPFQRAG